MIILKLVLYLLAAVCVSILSVLIVCTAQWIASDLIRAIRKRRRR